MVERGTGLLDIAARDDQPGLALSLRTQCRLLLGTDPLR
jgi:hypothetical protein